ncbi:MAG: NAD(P)-binding domain-containing protein [Thermoproteus sp. AZ2]|jgi:ketol-acid reductoisomerase|uniref:NAD(P)-binding domain-containing protein n=1 Tax=Thermoproteus sp. AZ2 TaxID=1609232 RepID=A0ACC6UY54_9CREN|nr:MAG: ketol-acid reductoisomerase [Thermoproteus sp. AZ2]
MRIYREGDAAYLKGRPVAVIGYGNVGRSLALNLRDSGVAVLVGNLLSDEYARTARADGFEVHQIPEAAELAEVVVVALPDDVMPEVYRTEVLPALHAGKALALTSGFPLAFGLIPMPPDDVDVVLFAPKLVGPAIRDRYLAGRGYAAVVGVVRDATGNALNAALALAAAAGVFRPGGFAVEARAEEEALADLLGEHVLRAALLAALEAAAEEMARRGVPKELIALELFASGEIAELLGLMSTLGPQGALKRVSPADAYGVLTRWRKYLAPLRRIAGRAAEEVADGRFARELALERQAGYPVLNASWRIFSSAEINQAAAALRALLRQ